MKKKKGQSAGTFGIVRLFSLFLLSAVLTCVFCSGGGRRTIKALKLSYPELYGETARELFLLETVRDGTEEQETVNENAKAALKEKEVIKNGYTTPSDIILMQEQFRKSFSSAESKGTVLQRQYNAENATDVFGSICLRNTTQSHSADIESSLNGTLYLDIKDKALPTVLVFHTHTTESYEMLDEGWFTPSYSTRSTDPARNMVRVGDAICEELEKNNIGVIHDTRIHDSRYTGAYDRSRASVEAILKKYPSIQITLDVHRDAIYLDEKTRVKAVSEINGIKAAQIMIIAGCRDGKVKSFEGWEKNLTFDLRLQKTAEEMFPGLMRPVLFCSRKYNMDVTPCSALLEFGSDSNTLAEAVYSGHLFGQALSRFIEENGR